MRESDTYMMILEEGIEKGLVQGIEKGLVQGIEKGLLQGRREEAKKLILRLGRKSLGAPDESVTTALTGIGDVERLELLLERLSEVKSWQELLATP